MKEKKVRTPSITHSGYSGKLQTASSPTYKQKSAELRSPEEVNDAIDRGKRNLSVALDIGAQMLSSGAEIERVEESVERICKSFGATEVEVFAITYVVIVTISGPEYNSITEIRRIHGLNRDLYKLSLLNALSREICDQHLTYVQASRKLNTINQERKHSIYEIMGIYAIISAAFTVFFGGSVSDAICAAVIGVLVAPVEKFMNWLQINRFVNVCLCSIAAGALAVLCMRLSLADSADLVSIGNIMIFIPGVIFTCAIQEIFSNNMLSGLTRLAEAFVLSIVIASGFVLVNLLT